MDLLHLHQDAQVNALVAERVASSIRDAGLVPDEAGPKVGISAAQLRGRLAGRTSFRMTELVRLGALTGVTVEDYVRHLPAGTR